jgi:hypothetical protein
MMGRLAGLCVFFAQETEFDLGIAGVAVLFDCMMGECSRQTGGAWRVVDAQKGSSSLIKVTVIHIVFFHLTPFSP